MKRRQFLVGTGAFLLAAGLPPMTALAKPPANLPPGRSGGPLGETLKFVKDPFTFLSDHHRAYGPAFRTKLLGRNIVCLHGPDAMTAFLDEDNVSRQESQLNHVTKLFGGVNMGQLDGDHHRPLKALALRGFDRQALSAYVAGLDDLAATSLARWKSEGEVRGVDVLRRFAIEAICSNVLGLAPGEATDALRADYARVAAGMISVPLRLPGSTYARAHRARKRIFERFEALIAERRATPGDDGMSRIMAATTESGRKINDAELILELHHIVIAGYIVFGLLGELLVRLAARDDLRAALIAELDAAGVDASPTLEQLYGLAAMRRVISEAKRTAPVVPVIFGVARRAFEVEGYEVPPGWGVWMSIRDCNLDPRPFAAPESFDPDRYASPRTEQDRHPHAWMPQGSGPATGHRCLGLEYSELVCQVFLTRVLRGSTWSIPEQDMAMQYALLPPEPADGLRVSFA